MSRFAKLSTLALALAAPLAAAALDAPHDASNAFQCQNCHVGHKSAGTGLTNNSINSALCDSCHNASTSFGFPWASSMQAQAGAAGSSHSWSALATNLGATSPDPSSTTTLTASMGQHLDTGGKLKCSTCHDVHNAHASPGTLHTSVALATNLSRTAGTGTGTLQLTAVPSGAAALGYVIQVATATTFRISHDNGTSWFGWNGSAWAAGVGTGKTFASGTPVSLDDGLTTMTFTGTFVAGDTFQKFYVSYPFLRGDAATMCVTCHQDRNQTWQNVEGTGPIAGNGQAIVLGTTYFSHPVNQALNANGHGYDAANATSIVDADGSLQGVGDGNKTNDLVLNASGNVTCMTCHHPHNADSNSLTTDPR